MSDLKKRFNLLTIDRQEEMARKEMKKVSAGAAPGSNELTGSQCDIASCCSCGCKYANMGGSSTHDNFSTNYLSGCLVSPGVDSSNAKNPAVDWDDIIPQM